MTVAEAVTAGALESAFRRHAAGGFSFDALALALVREGWRHPMIQEQKGPES